MKKVIYHDTHGKAKRAYRPRAGETIAYRSIKEFDEDFNDQFDEVVDLSTPVKKKKGD